MLTITILFLIIILPILWIINDFSNNSNVRRKYKLSSKSPLVQYKGGHPLIDDKGVKNLLFIWVDKNYLYLINKFALNNNRNKGFSALKSPINDIVSFTRKGDFYVTQNISVKGGGGGGSSIGGAVVGGFVAGVPGAIIGSRKRVKPVKVETRSVEVDKRVTIVELKYNGRLEYVILGSNAYDFLIRRIPGKEKTFA